MLLVNYNEFVEMRTLIYDDYIEHWYRLFAELIDCEKAIDVCSQSQQPVQLERAVIETALNNKRTKN